MTHQLFEDVVGFVGRCRSEVAAIGEQVAMEMGERFSVQGKNPIFRRLECKQYSICRTSLSYEVTSRA